MKTKGTQPVLVISENTTAYADEKYLVQPPAIAAFIFKVELRTKKSNMKNIFIK